VCCFAGSGISRLIVVPVLKLCQPCMGTWKPQSNGPLYSNMVIGSLAVDEWAVTFVTARRGLGGRAAALPSPLLAVPNVTAHPSTASGLIGTQCTFIPVT